MIQLGKYNTLKAFRETEFGWYLIDQDEMEEILLPKKFVPEHLKENEEIEVFIFNDSEDRATATTQVPKIQLHEFACLQAIAVSEYGAFMDWGMDKDLLVPFSEQNKKMEKGRKYLVYLYLDDRTERLVGSSRLQQFLEKEDLTVEEGEEVDLLIGNQTELGVHAIINNLHLGLIFNNEIFHNIQIGDRTKGFIKKIREDGKIDLTLQKQGYQNIIPDTAQKILEKLKFQDGFIPLTDKSDPQDIYIQLEMSKKNFKKAIGSLYKQKLISIEVDGIRLLTEKI